MLAAGVISLPHLIVVLVIALLLFGGSRLRNLGGDLGNAIKGFKKAMNEEDKDKESNKDTSKLNTESHKIIEGSIEKEKVSTETDHQK